MVGLAGAFKPAEVAGGKFGWYAGGGGVSPHTERGGGGAPCGGQSRPKAGGTAAKLSGNPYIAAGFADGLGSVELAGGIGGIFGGTGSLVPASNVGGKLE